MPALAARSCAGGLPARACAFSTSAAAAGCCASRSPRSAATIVGADPARGAIEAARLHARGSGLAIDYRGTTAEALAAAGERFDIVLAMEVIEHVADHDVFLVAAPRWSARAG